MRPRIVDRATRVAAVLLALSGRALDDDIEDPGSLAVVSAAATAFGVTTGGGFVTVSSGAGLVYRVRQSNGDIASIKWNDRELNDQSKASHLSSGLGSATVTSSLSPSGTTALVTITTSTV